jgi:hypothetical protein
MWTRVSIDLSHRGDVLGWSLEVHDEEGIVSIYVVPVGPFDPPLTVLAEAIRLVAERHGEQLTLGVF